MHPGIIGNRHHLPKGWDSLVTKIRVRRLFWFPMARLINPFPFEASLIQREGGENFPGDQTGLGFWTGVIRGGRRIEKARQSSGWAGAGPCWLPCPRQRWICFRQSSPFNFLKLFSSCVYPFPRKNPFTRLLDFFFKFYFPDCGDSSSGSKSSCDIPPRNVCILKVNHQSRKGMGKKNAEVRRLPVAGSERSVTKLRKWRVGLRCLTHYGIARRWEPSVRRRRLRNPQSGPANERAIPTVDFQPKDIKRQAASV